MLNCISHGHWQHTGHIVARCGFQRLGQLPATFLNSFHSCHLQLCPLHFLFHSHSFTYCSFRNILSGLLSHLLKSEWKPPWLHNSCILHVWKTSATWMTLRFSANGSSDRSPLNCGCQKPDHCWTLGNTFLNYTEWARLLGALFSKQSVKVG